MAHEFSWSLSRHDSFATCRRRYFYAYYAAVDDAEVRRLKGLSALPLWAGSVVHETIEDLLKARDATPDPEEQEAIIHSVIHSRMRSEWQESEAGSARFRLFEHEYDVPVAAEDKKIVVDTVQRSLRHFFRSSTLSEAYSVGRGRWLTVEDLVRFPVDGVTVYARMDLAYRDSPGRTEIVDWKTGRSQGRFNDVQLAGYALYAASVGWVSGPDEIETELVYLAVPRHVRRRVTQETLDHAHRFIAQSAGEMTALLIDPSNNLARREDFPLIDRPSVCRRCNFRRLCFPRVEPAGDTPSPRLL